MRIGVKPSSKAIPHQNLRSEIVITHYPHDQTSMRYNHRTSRSSIRVMNKADVRTIVIIGLLERLIRTLFTKLISGKHKQSYVIETNCAQSGNV